MRVINKLEAWKLADEIFPTDYEHDEARSERAGYPIYYSTAEGVNAYICDLGDRLEVNLPSGASINIWVEHIAEKDIGDALRVIDDALYRIDDNISLKVREVLGIEEVRAALYKVFETAAKILPKDSETYNDWNLKDF